MLPFFDHFRDVNLTSVLLRLSLSFLLGAIIGLERSYKNRPAGFRTHILVCIGATVASMTGVFLYLNLNFPTDISRLGAQVVSGLGFIGAGTIIVTRNYKVKGLTTAAGLWTSGIIGLAVGAGFYEGALVAAVLVLIAETCFTNFVHHHRRDPEFQIDLSYTHKPALDQVLRCCKNNRLSITNLRVIGLGGGEDANASYSALIDLRPRLHVDKSALLQELAAIDGVSDVQACE